MKVGTSFPTFDAELSTDCCDPYNNAELTLTLQLGFRQINPAGGAAEGTYHDFGDASDPTRKIVKWTNGSWNLWKHNFITSATRFWNGRFWLTNDHDVYSFDKNGVKYWPNVWCRLEIKDRAIALGSHHHVIDVVRLHRDEDWFGSHSTLYDSLDINSVEKGTDSAGRPIMQRAHVHEVGHLLGLAHVDVGKAHCPPGGDTNAGACYGVADVDKYSVMGQGMQLRAAHAGPWRRAAITLSGKGAFLTPTDWAPSLRRIYPRTAAEVALKAAITNRPLRK